MEHWRVSWRELPRTLLASLHGDRLVSHHCPGHRLVSKGQRGTMISHTGSGLCEAVTITPMVFPSSFLLLRAAITPTLNITESRVLPLLQVGSSFAAERWDGNHVQCPESRSAILEAKVARLWMPIRSDFERIERQRHGGYRSARARYCVL